MKRKSKVKILFRMLGLVKPLTGYMMLAVCLGTLGFLTAQFIPILGGYAILYGLGLPGTLSLRLSILSLSSPQVSDASIFPISRPSA